MLSISSILQELELGTLKHVKNTLLSIVRYFIILNSNIFVSVNVPDPDPRRTKPQYKKSAKYFVLTLVLFNLTCILYRYHLYPLTLPVFYTGTTCTLQPYLYSLQVLLVPFNLTCMLCRYYLYSLPLPVFSTGTAYILLKIT